MNNDFRFEGIDLNQNISDNTLKNHILIY